MPTDKKKSGSGGESSNNQKAAMTLHANAKEFVPSFALKANTAAWKPVDNASKSAAASKKASPQSSGSDSKKQDGAAPNNVKAKPASAAAAVASKPPSAAEAVKQAPKPKPAPAPPVAAWGSKPSEAIKKAGPIKPQQKQQAPQSRQGQQQNQGRGGRDGGRHRGSGKRNDQQQGRGGGGSNSGGGGSWARAAAKPGTGGGGGDRKDSGGGGRNNQRRQPQSGRQNQSHHRSSGHGGPGGGDQGNDNGNPNWSRGKAVPLELLGPGEGKSDAQKGVRRINVEDLLAMRLDNLNPPSTWEGEDGEEGAATTKPPPACLWDSPTRVSEIEANAAADRIGGDVSRKDKSKQRKPNPNDTAPALEDCKPLEVNEETRWKAKVMDGKDANTSATEGEEEGKDEILRKAMFILNKLSLTKFDKLSDEFIACGIGRDVECLTGAVELIVSYAQEQQHFSSMYAGLCLKLANTPLEGIDEGSKKGKKFKKILLERCQHEFDADTATKIKEATKDTTDKEEIEYHANLIKKHYLGHMRFIGELYKGDLISIKIMLFCLPALLKGEHEETWADGEVDEEKIECFSKLMTVIGSSLEQQSEAMRSVGKADAANNLADCWRTVEIMAGRRKEEGPKVSNRIKFMLQDLLEMKEKGWVTRRKEETAKTIAQIHKEVAKEERAARKSSSSANLRAKGSLRRGASSGDVRVMDKAQNKPQVDKDGFVSVPTSSKGFNRSGSMPVMTRNQSKEGFQKYSTRGSVVMGKQDGGGMTQRGSQGKFAVLNESDSRRNSKKGSSNKLSEKVEPVEEKKPKVNYPSPDECGDKAKNILKEFFVGGDTDDAVLSIHELVGAGDEGSVDRGSKVVESAVLMVLEMKQENIDKFLAVYLRCAKEKKIEGESFVTGLNDPLEFLSDVAIDAPLAIPHLAGIVAELVKGDIIQFDFLLNSPDYFRTDQNAAGFGAKVMKKIGDDATSSENYIEVIEKLMTDEDKAKHSSAKHLIAEA